MPLRNYCKKCAMEVPPGESCAHCGAKLTKTGERLSFERQCIPARDWFSWNQILRVSVPVVALVLLTTILLEGVAEGSQGIRNVFLQGFFWTMTGALGLFLAVTFALLSLQGSEKVRYVLDAKGAHVYTCLHQPGRIRLYARLTTPAAVESLQADRTENASDGWTTVRRVDLPWSAVRRVRLWAETGTLLLYHPVWWQAVCIRCSDQDYEDALAYLQKKLGKKKSVWGRIRKKQ